MGKNLEFQGGAMLCLSLPDAPINTDRFSQSCIIHNTTTLKMAQTTRVAKKPIIQAGTVTITSEEYFNLLGVKLVLNPNGSVADVIKQQQQQQQKKQGKTATATKTNPIKQKKKTNTPLIKKVQATVKSLAKKKQSINTTPNPISIPTPRPTPTPTPNATPIQTSISNTNQVDSSMDDDISIGSPDFSVPIQSSIELDNISCSSIPSLSVRCIYQSESKSPILPRLPDVTTTTTNSFVNHPHLVDDNTFNQLIQSILEPTKKTNRYYGTEEKHLNYASDVLDFHLKKAIKHAIADFDLKFRK